MKKIKSVCLDLDRPQRQGFPEAIYCPGKTVVQIINIAQQLYRRNQTVIATRANVFIYRKLKKYIPTAKFHPSANLITIVSNRHLITDYATKKKSNRYIAVVTAGTADISVAEETAVTAEFLGARVERIYDVGVAGLHRVLDHNDTLKKSTCIVVCAGMEGALPSVVAGLVPCPVIGVPTSVGYGTSFAGISSLLTMLNSCAPNVCVVNIDDGYGAGVLAFLINK